MAYNHEPVLYLFLWESASHRNPVPDRPPRCRLRPVVGNEAAGAEGREGDLHTCSIISKGKEQKDEVGEVRRLRGFRTTTVFDLAQTDGEALPTAPAHDATEGGDDLLPQIEVAVRDAGIAFVYKVIASGAQGLSKGGTIEIDERQGTAAKCGTLIHEFAHELLHKEDRSQGKQQRELEAEAVAYAVLCHYNIQSGSRFYLASYGITGEMLTASMQTIAKTARQIIEKIEARDDQKEAEDASALPLAA